MTRCPVPSSVTGVPCLLEEGHAPWRPDRFHRYGPDPATEEASARLVAAARSIAEHHSLVSPQHVPTAQILDVLYRILTRHNLGELFSLADGRMRPAAALTEHELHRVSGEWVSSCPSCLEGLAHADHYALTRGGTVEVTIGTGAPDGSREFLVGDDR